MDNPKTRRNALLSIFILGLALRLFLVPNHGFEADVAFWKSWGLSALDNGVVEGIEVTNNNYPTPFSYFLAFLAFTYRIFQDPHNFEQFWNSGNVLFLLIAKLPSILSDLGIAALLYLIISNKKIAQKFHIPILPYSFSLLLPALYLFNPVTLIDGAVWGQVDSLGVFVFFLSILYAVMDFPMLGGAVFILSMMTKLQNMIYAPLFFLLLWQLGSYQGLMNGILGAAASFLTLNGEFFLKKKSGAVIDSLTSNYDYFPLMSLNAFNLWWVAAKAQGMQVSDKFLTVGIMNAKTTGLILFSASYLMAVITMIQKTIMRLIHRSTFTDRHRILSQFFTGLILVCLSFFLFQTESHDRYAFPVTLFYLVWGIYFVFPAETTNKTISFWKTKTFLIFITGYIIFSFLFFLNLHTALAFNYPNNSLSFLLPLMSPSFTIPLAVFQTTLFFIFIVVSWKQIGWSALVLSTSFLMWTILLINLPLVQKKPITLTSLTPHISQQGYGMRRTNMPVNTNNTSSSWNRLSVQYSFYKKGIGTHASSYIVYHINGLFKRFTGDVGIDTQAGGKGSAVFRIFGDNKLLFDSGVVKRYEYPKHFDISITNIQTISLIVDDGGDGNTDDHADWLNPQLWP